MDTQTKYFFISARGSKFKNLDTEKGEDIEDVLKSLSLDGKTPDEQKQTMSHSMDISSVIEMPSGMFIPSYIENYLKQKTGVDIVVINFVREMSYDEFIADSVHRANLTIKSQPKPIGNNVLQEIDDILNQAEKGDLRVIKPETPDVPTTKEEQDLLDLGLPTNLFDDTGLWDNEE